MNPADTIVAVSSATGPAARMIVRVAGPDAVRLLRSLSPDAMAQATSAEYRTLTFDGIVCPAWVYTFLAPRSYTGDDLVELHVPGNPLLARTLVETLAAAGARHAEAGEFTARAFLNGRLDLAAAEGVALTIAATHAGELRAARQLLAGELSRRLAGPLESLAEALALIESNIDFAEEDIAFIDGDEVRRRIEAASAALDDLTTNAARFDRIAGESSFVLVGLPNAGKSTLLNALAGHERAVVSPIAGTTRDALSAEVPLRRGLVRIIDVAGLEAAGDDEISRQMQARARRTVEEADFVIEVIDGASGDRAWLPRQPDLVVETKLDLTDSSAESQSISERPDATAQAVDSSGASEESTARAVASNQHVSTSRIDNRIKVSARTGAGLQALKDRLDALAFGASASGDALALTARHLAAVEAARDALRQAAARPADAPELLADAVRSAVDSIGHILWIVSHDDVLGRVFATFCVGK